MSQLKYKSTAFTRLFIFVIIALPLIYILASYINGEDGIENIKSLFGQEQTTSELITEKENEIKDLELKIEELQSDIRKLKTLPE